MDGQIEIGNITMDWIKIRLGFDSPMFTLDSNELKIGLGLDLLNLIRLISII